MKKLKKLLAPVLVLVAALLYYLFGYNPSETPETPGDPVDPVSSFADLMEIPALSTDGRLVQHGAYVSSYNTETLIPDWVAYELTAEETGGNRSREGMEFKMDPDLKGCTQAMREDYSGSGWTKGHLMPAADAGVIAMHSTIVRSVPCMRKRVFIIVFAVNITAGQAAT